MARRMRASEMASQLSISSKKVLGTVPSRTSRPAASAAGASSAVTLPPKA